MKLWLGNIMAGHGRPYIVMGINYELRPCRKQTSPKLLAGEVWKKAAWQQCFPPFQPCIYSFRYIDKRPRLVDCHRLILPESQKLGISVGAKGSFLSSCSVFFPLCVVGFALLAFPSFHRSPSVSTGNEYRRRSAFQANREPSFPAKSRPAAPSVVLRPTVAADVAFF